MGSSRQHGDELQRDLASLKENLNGLATHLSQALGDVGQDVSEDMRKRVQKLGGEVDRAITAASSKGQDVARQLSPDNVSGTLESTVRDYPLTALAIAVGVGALVGSRLHR